MSRQRIVGIIGVLVLLALAVLIVVVALGREPSEVQRQSRPAAWSASVVDTP